MNASPPRIFDWNAILRARRRAIAMEETPFLARIARAGMVDRVSPVNRRFERAVMIDPFYDMAELHGLAEAWSQAAISDVEQLLAPHGEYDLAVSILGLHCVNDLPGMLSQIRQVLLPDGLFCGALFGGATLQELRECLATAEFEITGGLGPHIYPFADVRAVGNLLQRAGLALCVADCEVTTVWYRDLRRVLHDLRAHAQTNVLTARTATPLSRKVFEETARQYALRYGRDDGKIPATFEIIYAMGWSPAETQQKPLLPGSARTQLAHALKPAGGSDESY